MKRILAWILAITMILALVGCSSSLGGETTAETGKTTQEEEKTLSETVEEKAEITIPAGFTAGFADQVVNPEDGIWLGGFPGTDSRVSESIRDDLVLSCLAVSDGDNIFLYFAMDSTQMGASISKRMSEIAEKSFGSPANNVIVNASHTHSGPGLYSSGATGTAQYMKKIFYPATESIIESALLDLSAATLQFGTTEAEGMNYVRRYINKVNNTYVGKNIPKDSSADTYAHETEPDSVLRILRFVREGKEDIVICNWQCHPCTAGIGSASATIVSSDWVSSLRDTVEKTEKVQFLYMQGAAGNLANGGRIQGDQSWSDYRAYGKELATYVSKAMNDAREVASGKVQVKRQDIKVDYSAEYLKKNNVGKTHSMSLWAISFGEVGIGTLPGELHDSLGVELREKSPFKATLFSGYTNGTNGYFAADFAYDNGGYEVESSRHERGTSEEMVNKLVAMLQELNQTK
jgi:hypothetical protein